LDPGIWLYEIAVTGTVSPFDHVYEFPFGSKKSILSAVMAKITDVFPVEYPVVAATFAVGPPDTSGVPWISPPDVKFNPSGILMDEYAKIGSPLAVKFTRTRTGVMGMFCTRDIVDKVSNVKVSSTTTAVREDVPVAIPSVAVSVTVFEYRVVGTPENVRFDPTFDTTMPDGSVDDVKDVMGRFALDVAVYTIVGSRDRDRPIMNWFELPGAGATVTVSTATVMVIVISPTISLVFVARRVDVVVPAVVGVPVKNPRWVIELKVTETPGGSVVDVIDWIFAFTAVPGKKLSALSRYVFGIGTPVYNPSMLAPSRIDPTNKTASVYENAIGVVFDKDPASDLRFAVKVPDPSRPSAPLVVPMHESPIEQFESAG